MLIQIVRQNSTGVFVSFSGQFLMNMSLVSRYLQIPAEWYLNMNTWSDASYLLSLFGEARHAGPAQLSVNHKKIKYKFYWIYSAISRVILRVGCEIHPWRAELNMTANSEEQTCVQVSLCEVHMKSDIPFRKCCTFFILRESIGFHVYGAAGEWIIRESRFQVWVALDKRDFFVALRFLGSLKATNLILRELNNLAR